MKEDQVKKSKLRKQSSYEKLIDMHNEQQMLEARLNKKETDGNQLQLQLDASEQKQEENKQELQHQKEINEKLIQKIQENLNNEEVEAVLTSVMGQQYKGETFIVVSDDKRPWQKNMKSDNNQTQSSDIQDGIQKTKNQSDLQKQKDNLEISQVNDKKPNIQLEQWKESRKTKDEEIKKQQKQQWGQNVKSNSNIDQLRKSNNVGSSIPYQRTRVLTEQTIMKPANSIEEKDFQIRSMKETFMQQIEGKDNKLKQIQKQSQREHDKGAQLRVQLARKEQQDAEIDREIRLLTLRLSGLVNETNRNTKGINNTQVGQFNQKNDEDYDGLVRSRNLKPIKFYNKQQQVIIDDEEEDDDEKDEDEQESNKKKKHIKKQIQQNNNKQKKKILNDSDDEDEDINDDDEVDDD